MREAEPHEHEEMRESDDLAGEEIRRLMPIRGRAQNLCLSFQTSAVITKH